tara:strand:+ start:140 stop:682 length:543 start_codon:yes stop_codon:yes gene_type:complete
MHKNLLQKYYFIDKLEENNIENLDKHTSVIYRNYNSKISTKQILKIFKICKRRNIKFYLSNNLKLAVKCKLDGLYIPSFNKKLYTRGLNLKKDFQILGSAHNISEIRQKEIQGVKKIFISSIFKKNQNFLGLYRFSSLKNRTNKDVVALGGINSKNLSYLKLIKIKSFAGISFFQKKTPQ